MDEKIVKEILDTLFSSLEETDARSAAALQFLKDKKLATDEELAPTLKQAETAASVRWRAARARIEYLLAGITREEVKPPEPQPGPTKEKEEAKEKKEDKTDQPDNKKERPGENTPSDKKAAPPPDKD